MDRILHALAGLMREGGTMALVLCELSAHDGDLDVDVSKGEPRDDARGLARGPRAHRSLQSQDGILRRWREVLRPTDSLSWAGENRFAIVLERLLKPSNLDVILERLAECGFDGPWAALTCSAPLADPSLILQEAHALLDSSREGLCEHATTDGEDPKRHVRIDHLHCVRGDLLEQRGPELEEMIAKQVRDGFERGELHVAYQPVVSVATRRLQGFEALLRWEHPDRGVVLPSVFLSSAEKTGAILDIGRWVLEEACGLSTALLRTERFQDAEKGALKQQRSESNELTMTVNLTMGQALEPGLIERIEHLKAVGLLDPERFGLRLELDQSSLAALEPSIQIKEAIAKLRRLGMKVGVDNFGLGASSLKMLKELSVSSLSMDKSLVERIDVSERDRLLAKAVVDLTHANSMEVIAEGVERPEQLEALAEMGCDLAEGFLFGRAMRASELDAYLSSANPFVSFSVAPSSM